MSHGHSIDGLPERSNLRDKVILEKSASLLENLAIETVFHMLMPQYIKMTMAQREKKTHQNTLYKHTRKSPSISLKCRLNLYCPFRHDFYKVKNNAREH